MSGWRLKWKRGLEGGPRAWIDGSTLRPDTLAPTTLEALLRIPMGVGQRARPLGELFDVEPFLAGGDPLGLSVEGSRRFVGLGAGMRAGTLDVEGPGGELLGARMEGGTLVARGNAGDAVGAGLRGGLIVVHGSAGDRVGAPLEGEVVGMAGGELVILGDAGSELGGSMRRGLIVVTGEAGPCAGHRMRAGTIVVARGELVTPGIEMRRGSILGLGSRSPPGPGFRPDGLVWPVWTRILLARLRSLGIHLQPSEAALLDGSQPLKSYSGDSLSLGRGEVLLT